MRNYYDTLGVTRGASATEIKARYRALSKTYHPDVGGSEAQMAQLNHIYRTLTNPLEKAKYDRQLLRESEAAHAAAERRAQAARAAREKTTAQHKAARELAEQEAIFAATPSPKTAPRKPRFWKVMAWSTAGYVIAALGFLYAITMPSTAADTSIEPTQTTSLAQEAAQASDRIPETPANVTQTAPEEPATTTTDQAQTPAQEQPAQKATPQDTDPQNCDSKEDATCRDEQKERRLDTWRRFMPF